MYRTQRRTQNQDLGSFSEPGIQTLDVRQSSFHPEISSQINYSAKAFLVLPMYLSLY